MTVGVTGSHLKGSIDVLEGNPAEHGLHHSEQVFRVERGLDEGYPGVHWHSLVLIEESGQYREVLHYSSMG